MVCKMATRKKALRKNGLDLVRTRMIPTGETSLMNWIGNDNKQVWIDDLPR